MKNNFFEYFNMSLTRKRRRITTPIEILLRENASKITQAVKKYELLLQSEDYSEDSSEDSIEVGDIRIVKESSTTHLDVPFKFKFNEDTYCTGTYTVDASQQVKCHIPSVYSDLENRTGTFLFHLQVLLAITVNCIEITLENFTNEPVRAAIYGGIYELFEVDQRGHVKSFNGEDLAEQLTSSEGEMRFKVNAVSIPKWVDKIERIAEGLTGPPWNDNVKANMIRFLNYLRQNNFLSGGGRKIKKSKRYKYKMLKKKTPQIFKKKYLKRNTKKRSKRHTFKKSKRIRKRSNK